MLSQASPDLMRSLLQHVINALLPADADTVCGAQWGQQDPQRHTQRNGYHHRSPGYQGWHHRRGDPQAALRHLFSRVAAFPEWSLQRRKRSDSALITMVADRLLSGSIHAPHGRARQNPGDHRTLCRVPDHRHVERLRSGENPSDRRADYNDHNTQATQSSR